MKKIYSAAAVVACLMAMASCSTPTYRVADSKILHTAYSVTSNTNAELEVSSTRESFTYTVTEQDGYNGKTNATYAFLEKYGADIIVEPRYERIISGGTTIWKITGRPATLKNFTNVPVKSAE